MSRQQLSAQQGEIEFRRQMALQETEAPSPDAPGADETVRLLRQRMGETADRMRQVASRGATLAPYLEIGAERGQRALALENELGAHGAAADLSLDMLKGTAHWARRMGAPNLPLRVCCDAHALPFASGSLPLVFCYQTLHHFPDPEPVLSEIRRVLAPGGTFVFDEEPFRRALRQHWFHPDEPGPDAGRARRALHRVLQAVSDPGQDEVRYGIVENHGIPVAGWRALLEGFEERDVVLTAARGHVRSGLDAPRGLLVRALLHLLGGSIGGRCRKPGPPGPGAARVEEALACPACLASGVEHRLVDAADAWLCAACAARYPVIDGVAVLLVPEKRAALYPQYA